MPIIVSAEGDKPRELPDADIHRAVCAFVYDLGQFPDPKWGKVQHKVIVAWELEQKMADGRPFMLSKEYTLSLWEKSALYKHLTAWKGSPLSALEMKAFDLESLVGKQCRLNVIHKTAGNGKTYANVDSVLPADKKAEALTVESKEPPKWFEAKRQEYAAAMAKYEGGAPPDSHDASAGLDEVPF